MHLPLIDLFTVNNNCFLIIKLFTVNNNLPLIKTVSVNDN